MKILALAILASFCVVIASGDKDREWSKDVNDWKKEEFKGSRTNKRDSLSTEPVVGHFNLTSSKGELCLRMDAGIRLDVTYLKKNGSSGTTTIVSDNDTVISKAASRCFNGSKDITETLALRLSQDRLLRFVFTRDQNVTGDKKEQKWQLNQIVFMFVYDENFPDAKDKGSEVTLQNTDNLKEITASTGRSYGCTKLDPILVTDMLKVTLTSLRVQPFFSSTSEEFGQADWCANEQTSDLIPIIIGAALAALVIIVLIAYLIGRARSKNTSYDNI